MIRKLSIMKQNYSLSLFLQLYDTKEKDIHELIELARYGLPDIRNRFNEMLNQVAARK
jgi:hypothetical protein